MVATAPPELSPRPFRILFATDKTAPLDHTAAVTVMSTSREGATAAALYRAAPDSPARVAWRDGTPLWAWAWEPLPALLYANGAPIAAYLMKVSRSSDSYFKPVAV